MLQKIKLFINTTRFKTTIWYASLFFILEIFLGTIVYIYIYKGLHHQLDRSLERQARVIHHFFNESKVDFENFEPDSLYIEPSDLIWDIIYEAVVFNPRNTFIQIKQKDKILFKSENLMKYEFDLANKSSNNVELSEITNANLSAHPIRCAVLNDGKYQILVAFPIEFIHDTLSKLTDIYVVIAPIFLVLSILGGGLISIRSLSRIDSIIKKTETITAYNLNEKIWGEEFNDEYGRLVRQMNNMIQRIKISIDYMNQFSISASHELKTPLTILRGEIEVALKSAKNKEELEETLKSNLEETLRLINIVDNLFFISKVDHSLIKLNKERTNLNNYLIEIIRQMKPIAAMRNIKFIFKSENNYDLNIDRDLCRHAIFNLIDNAIKYGEENQSLIIQTNRFNEQRVKISIINKGEGIPPESIPKVFDRFYRVESSRNRNTGGAGLGLSVACAIVKLHNGEISVKSIPNEETEFSIILNLI